MGPGFIDPNNQPKIHKNPWTENLFRPILLIGAMTCLSIAMVNLAKTFNPSWQGTYFLVGMISVTIEAVYSHRMLRRQGHIRDIPSRYHLVEWGTIMLFLKALTYVNKPWGYAAADIQSWATEPLDIFTLEFIVICTLSFVIWSATANTMKAFDALFDQFAPGPKAVDPFTHLTHRFYGGGVLLIFISGIGQWIGRSGLGVVSDLNRPSTSGVFLNVLIYFVLGLILLSQTQLYILSIGWHSQDFEVSPRLKRRWALHGIMVLAIVGAAVFFLPTSYTLGFLASVKLMLQLVLKSALLVAQLAWTIVIFLLKPLLSLFSLDKVAFQKRLADRTMYSPDLHIDTPHSHTAYSCLFWLILSIVVLYLLRTYFKDRPELLKWLRHLRWFHSWLAKLWQWLRGTAHAVIEFIPGPAATHTGEPDTKAGSKRRRFRLDTMSSRQRIIYYYLRTLKSAEKSGLIRQTSQTPAEFAPELAKALPDKDAEINRLTEAFVQARYSRGTFGPEQALSVKRMWKYIHSALRGMKKQRTA